MKKQVWIILLAVVCCCALVLGACNPPAEHKCQHECPTCHKCTSDCKDEACKEKCPGHQTEEHVCGHVCPVCNKCTDATCNNAVCADKCQGHTETVKVTGIIVSTDDETHEGTLESPLDVELLQAHDVELAFNVRPTNATNKALTLTVGSIVDNVFVAATSETGITATVENKIKLTASADVATGGGIVVEVKAQDGSNVAVYLNVIVREYVSVSKITSSVLKVCEEEGYDYELLTAVGTNWNMSYGMTTRGQGLLDGTADDNVKDRKCPRNLIYFPNVFNLGISVLPSNASEKDFTITYSKNDIVDVAIDGALTVKAAGETVVTVTSDSNSDVAMKIKVTVVDSLYRGLLKSAYDETTESVNVANGWDFDSDHGTAAQFSRFDDWHLVMVHSNLKGISGSDDGQKIFYDGDPNRPYGIGIENYVGANSGASILESTGMMWAKVTIPAGAITFNIKMEATGTGKQHSEYRVVFVPEEGEAVVMTDGWMKTPSPEAIVKVNVPASVKGQKGALIVETKVAKADEHVEFHAKVMKFEGQVDVTSIAFNKASAEYKVGANVIDSIKATVSPNNATNDKVIYSIHSEDADKGVTVNANTGVITIDATAAAGEYRIIATSDANDQITATFTLILTEDEIEVNEWDSSESDKNDIIGGVSDVAWVKVGEGIDSLNEGESIQKAASVLKLENRKINATSFIMSIRIRCFGGTTSEIVLKVIDGDDTFEIPTISGQKAIPQDKGEGDWYSYDLSAYIGKTVTLTLGVKEDNDRAVVQHIKFTGSETKIINWANKDELLDTNGDPWAVEGQWNQGPTQGIDLQGAESYAHNTFVIGAYNAKFTFGGRIFVGQEGDKGFPEVKLVVVADGVETVVTAIDQSSDTIVLNGDNVTNYSYDLSAFIGKEVEIRIVCVKEVFHCVIANASMGAMEVVG